MMQEDALKEFIGGDNKMSEWVARQHGIPQAIFVDDGYMNLQELAKKVPKQYLSETSPGVFLARLPIVVGKKGILEIDKKTSELRLSQEAGAFLVNDNQLFVMDTKLTGWSEKANGPVDVQGAEGIPSVPAVLGRYPDLHVQHQSGEPGLQQQQVVRHQHFPVHTEHEGADEPPGPDRLDRQLRVLGHVVRLLLL